MLATPNVVYKLNCGICQKQYVGYTVRRLEDRAREHIPNWALAGLNKIARSSVTEHITNENHLCSWKDSFEILYRARNRKMLKYAEATAIRILKPCLNVQKDFDYQLKLAWE